MRMSIRRFSYKSEEIRQVTNRDKSLFNFLGINVHIKDKTGVLTYTQFKSVNNYSERRA